MSPKPSASARPLAELLDRSRADAELRHGCAILDVRPAARPGHLPGSARVPIEGDRPRFGELPSYLLSRPGSELIVVSDRVAAARNVAQELCERGWRADWCDAPLPEDELVPGDVAAALWRPDPYIRELLPGLLERGVESAADLGCGNGRDAVFLAQAGLDVFAADRLPECLDMVRVRARRHGVEVRTRIADIRRPEELPDASFDLILCVRILERELLARVGTLLRPRGHFVLHTYGLLEGVDAPRTMHAKNRASVDEIRAFFPGDRFEEIDPPRSFERDGEHWVRGCWRARA